MCHSERLYLLGMKLDIQGVLLLMWSATVPLIHHSLPPPPSDKGHPPWTSWHTTHLAATTLLASACSAATLLPRLSGPRFGSTRAALFACFGAASFVAPLAHGAVECGVLETARRVAAPWLGVTAVCNAVGAGVYMSKVREWRCLGKDKINKET